MPFNGFFDGSWKMERSENYDKFLEKLGVDEVKRKLASHIGLKLTVKEEGNGFRVKESSNSRNIEVVFEMGVPFKYEVADGTELSGSWKKEGNRLVGEFKRVNNGSTLQSVREIIGSEMVQTFVYEGIEAKRIFKRE